MNDTQYLTEATLFAQELGANLLTQSPISASNELVIVWDPEVGKQNPSENKQLKLARSVTRGVIDRELKPASNEKKYLPSHLAVCFSICKGALLIWLHQAWHENFQALETNL